MNEIVQRYSLMAPESLTEQFTDRVTKKEAMEKRKEREFGRLNTTLFPSGTTSIPAKRGIACHAYVLLYRHGYQSIRMPIEN